MIISLYLFIYTVFFAFVSYIFAKAGIFYKILMIFS